MNAGFRKCEHAGKSAHSPGKSSRVHELYNIISLAYQRHDLESLQCSIRELHLKVVQDEVDYDDTFMATGLGNILLVCMFDDNLPHEDHDFLVETMKEMCRSLSFAEAFVRLGCIEKIIQELPTHTNQCLSILVHLLWNKPTITSLILPLMNIPRDFVQMLPTQEMDQEASIQRARQVLYCLCALSSGVCPETFPDWWLALKSLFECRFLEFEDLTFTVIMAKNFCIDFTSSSTLSSCLPFVSLVNTILKDKTSSEELLIDVIAFLSRLLQCCLSEPSADVSFLSNFHLFAVKGLLKHKSDVVVKKVSKWLCLAAQTPFLEPEMATAPFLSLIDEASESSGFATTKHLVTATSILVGNAPQTALPTLIDNGVTHILARGLNFIDDQHFISDVLKALLRLMSANNSEVTTQIADTIEPFLRSVCEQTSVSPENDDLIRALCERTDS